jgi:hypothetical protein
MFRDGGAEAIARERGLDLEEAKHQWGSDGESLGPYYTRASLGGVHCRRGVVLLTCMRGSARLTQGSVCT